MEQKELLKISHLYKTFSLPRSSFFQRKRPVLYANDDVNVSILEGETFGLVGESGSGKSTLGRTVLQLLKPTSGEVLYYGGEEEEKTKMKGAGIDLTKLKPSEMRRFRKDLQMIFQDPYSSLNPRMTVGQIIEEGVAIHTSLRKNTPAMQEYVLTIMENCGLQSHMLHRYPHQFSGGQRQRICIARALAVKPKFVVCDECVSALDVSIQAQILNLLSDLKEKERLTYLFISHDLSVVRYISDRIAVMYLGRIVEMGKTEQIFNNPLHPYTQMLLDSVPTMGGRKQTKKMPSMDVKNQFQRIPAPLLEVEKGHFVSAEIIQK